MSTLREYLAQKRDALLARNAAAQISGTQKLTLQASVTAEGRSGYGASASATSRSSATAAPTSPATTLAPARPSYNWEYWAAA